MFCFYLYFRGKTNHQDALARVEVRRTLIVYIYLSNPRVVSSVDTRIPTLTYYNYVALRIQPMSSVFACVLATSARAPKHWSIKRWTKSKEASLTLEHVIHAKPIYYMAKSYTTKYTYKNDVFPGRRQSNHYVCSHIIYSYIEPVDWFGAILREKKTPEENDKDFQ